MNNLMKKTGSKERHMRKKIKVWSEEKGRLVKQNHPERKAMLERRRFLQLRRVPTRDIFVRNKY